MSSIADYKVATLNDFYTQSSIANAPKHTGRLALNAGDEKSTLPPYTLTAQEPYVAASRLAERINYRLEETPVNLMFFSEANISNLQGMIKNTVYEMSREKRYVIDNQNEADLKTVMRSYYLQYGMNDPNRVAEELKELNDRVVNWCSNNIMSEINAYVRYRKDIMDFPPPIENPVDTHIYGTRTGELKSFF
jgi:adenine C2-methylase RlmN of 23S rRNA A2503 and tRNA A37